MKVRNGVLNANETADTV